MMVSIKGILRDSFILFSLPCRYIHDIPFSAEYPPNLDIVRLILHDPDKLPLSIISYVQQISNNEHSRCL
jgi:hypothetical protein